MTTPKRLCASSGTDKLRRQGTELGSRLRALQDQHRLATQVLARVRKNELESLGDLAEKWEEAAIAAFHRIRGLWQEPLGLADMLAAGGFAPDLVDADAHAPEPAQHGSTSERDLLYCSSSLGSLNTQLSSPK